MRRIAVRASVAGSIRCLLAGGVMMALTLCPNASLFGQSLVYSTLIGGSKDDGGHAYAAVHDGSIIVVSTTRSTNFPVEPPSAASDGSYQVTVTKLSPDGNGAADLVWSQVFGGSDTERVRGVEVDAAGNIYLTGTTSSTDFDSDTGPAGPGIFVVALTPGGTRIYATVLGGADDPEDGGLAVDGAGYAYVTGTTTSSAFLDTVGSTFGGGSSDAVVVKLDPLGGIVYSRFLGGDGADGGRGITIDALGNAWVLGRTGSSDLPVSLGAVQAQLQGTIDAFAVKLDASGAITAATYLGGSDEEMGREGGIALGPQGTVWVTGRTLSTDFPTVNASDPTANGGTEGFVSQLSGDLDSLLYSTYLGGGSGERGSCVVTDAQGLAYVGGRTLSNDFPTTPDSFDPSFNGRHEGFYAVLDSSQTGAATLSLASYLGGSRDDGRVCIELGSAGGGNIRAYMVGTTGSRNDFPLTSGAYDTGYNGGQTDIFVSVFDFVATPDPVCNNGILEPGEVCDGSDLGGQTCDDLLGCVGGILLCNATCDGYDTTLCTGSNLVQEASEECDGMDFGALTCGDFGCGGGNLTCNLDCTIDASSCTACCAELGESCRTDGDCCSLNCSSGKPSSRTCLP